MVAYKLSPVGGAGNSTTELARLKCEHIEGEVPQGEVPGQIEHQSPASRDIDHHWNGAKRNPHDLHFRRCHSNNLSTLSDVRTRRIALNANRMSTAQLTQSQ